MRVYRRKAEERFAVLYVADVPDGSMYLEVGSRQSRHGEEGDYEPVADIDWPAGRFRRRLGDWEPLPERYYRESDIIWRKSEATP